MAGHSKWANIKHKKGAADAKRGKLFTKLGKEITIAVKTGGGKDVTFNPRLRLAIEKAKEANMPKDNIERAVKKGAGELDGGELVEVRYEGYGPGGVAVIVDALTDNKNRTAGEVRHAFSKFGGSLGETGSVGWMFDKKGLILVAKDKGNEEDIIDRSLKAGADDISSDDENFFAIYTQVSDLYSVKDQLEKDVKVEHAELSMIPNNTTSLEGDALETFNIFVEHTDNLDDTQHIYTNLE